MPHVENPGECDACGWKTDQLQECDAYARTRGHGPFTPEDQKEWSWLCNVCRSTLAGNVHLYPDQYSGETATIVTTLCWGINAVLDAIEKASPAR